MVEAEQRRVHVEPERSQSYVMQDFVTDGKFCFFFFTVFLNQQEVLEDFQAEIICNDSGHCKENGNNSLLFSL